MNKMNFNALRKVGQILAVAALAISVASCTKDDKGNDGDGRASQYFTLAYTGSTTGSTPTWAQSFTAEELADTELEISFIGKGYTIPSDRTARIYASKDGKTLYNLDYGTAMLYKLDVFGGQKYTELSKRNMVYAIGTTHPRWTKLDNDHALLHTVTSAVHVYKEDEEGDLIEPNVYMHTTSGAQLVEIDLTDMTFDDVQGVDAFPRSPEDIEKDLYIGRIDAPVVLDGKVYYGLFKSKYDPITDGRVSVTYQATSLVFDYPSLQNPTTISSTLAQGSTQGYRIPVSYVVDNSIYQMANSGQLLKITAGAYDNAYDFNLSTALGTPVTALGWFYVGNNIGYTFTRDKATGKIWGVTRIDIKAKTAIAMNVPANLSLGQYQMAKVGDDGKLYMCLTPVGGDGVTPGNIYIFDATKADKDGFAIGAKLKSGAGASYIGIF